MPETQINAQKLRQSIDELAEQIPTRSMYDTVLSGFADVYDSLESAKGSTSITGFEEKIRNARGRIKWYKNHIATQDEREPVHLALFHDDYSKVEFTLDHADAETPWVLANELSKHVRIDLNALVKSFWENTATRLRAHAEEGSEGRRFGFWPVVARTAPKAAKALWPVAAGALLGASAYSSTKAEDSESFLVSAKKTASTFGLGLAFGVAAALLIALRIER